MALGNARRLSRLRGSEGEQTRASLWQGQRAQIGGKSFYARSKWERNYAAYLEWLKGRKLIVDWSHENKTFWFEGVRRGVVSYLPDFEVRELNGQTTYHEVKGWMTPRSKTALRRMAKYYPDVRIILIDGAQIAAIRKYAAMIPDWLS